MYERGGGGGGLKGPRLGYRAPPGGPTATAEFDQYQRPPPQRYPQEQPQPSCPAARREQAWKRLVLEDSSTFPTTSLLPPLLGRQLVISPSNLLC